MKMRRGRKSRRKHTPGKAKPNYAPVIVLLMLSVVCGYLTAQYVVEPVVSYVPQLGSSKTDETDESDEDKTNSEKDSFADEIDTKKIQGYALQFGCYSSKSNAEKVIATLSADDSDLTDLQVVEQDDVYKIIGKLYETESEAKSALTKLNEGTKAFVTTIYEDGEET